MKKDLKDILDVQRIEDFLIKIEDLSRIEEKVILYHPDDPRYVQYWRSLKKKCIEGFWVDEFNKKRFVPGRLYFYKNFCTILDVDQIQNTRIKIQPDIRDVEWLRAYTLLKAEGFSGWSKDEEYSSDLALIEFNEEELQSLRFVQPERYSRLTKKDGSLKTYKPAWENITELKDKDLGVAHYWNNAQNLIELGCLHESVKVRMFDGTTKYSKDIQVGDKLMGVDSTPRTVTNLVRGKGIMYDVSTRYGDTYRVTDSHLHRVRKHKKLTKSKKRKKPLKYYENLNLDTNEILDLNQDAFKRQYEAIIQSVKYPEQEQLLDPYFIGYWLGDGFKREKLICYNEDDKSIIENWLIDYAESEERFSYSITEVDNSTSMGTKKMYRFRLIDNTMLYKNNYWSKTFRNNKHIPDNYLYSSTEQRLKLLAGFIDSDGSYDRTRFKVFNTDLKLIKQLQELSRSLGFKTTLNERIGGINNSKCYYLQITGDIHKIPTLYPRKQAKKPVSQGSRKNHITIDLTSGELEQFYGFEVDRDNLFLLEDYTVTHNSRGGGKSYWAALAVSKYELVFNGLKYYNEETLKKSPPKAEICIGSSRTDKSSDLVKKIVDSMEELASNHEFGTWGKVGDDDYTPSPFFKEMTGSYKPNNKDNLWRHEYQVNSNGNWRIKGTGSYLAHVTYSTQKKDGAEVAAGGRYGKLLYEEVGLIELLEEAYQSNKATVTVEGKQFGVQMGLGTSGNMETIIPAKKWFLNPALFDSVEFEDIYENSTSSIGFFLPAFLTHRGFKNKNGNTNVKEAVKHYLKRRQKYIDAKDSKGLEGEMMNYPMVPSEMFLTGDNNRLPIAEISDHIRELNLSEKFNEYATVGELVFSSEETSGVKFKPDNKAQLQPITTYPLQKGIPQDGAFVVYEHPITDSSGLTPKDLYIIGHDPVAKDQTTNQGSFASIFVLKTAVDPIKYGYYELVAEYIGRPFEGREQVNELLEKIGMYYGVSNGMLFFENQVGNVKEYFQKRNKLHFLATQPQKVMNSRGTYTNSITYGYPMSNKIIKDNAIDYLADWLKEPRILGLESNDSQKNKMNLNFIKSPRLLAELMSYNDKDNFDSVMGFLGCIIGIREKFNQYKNKEKEQEKQDRIKNIIDEFKKDDFILKKRYEHKKQYKQGNQPFAKSFL